MLGSLRKTLWRSTRLRCCASWLGLLLTTLTAAPAAERFTDQNFLLRNWDLDDGLLSTRVNAVARTADGYVWLATFNGVARFDGVRFVIFNSDNTPAFKDSRVASLLVDRAGVLCVGTYKGGLLKRAGDSFIATDLHAADGGWSVRALAQDAQGAICIGTGGGDLIRLNQGQAEMLSKPASWTTNSVSRLVHDTNGRLWALAGGSLLTFDAGRWGWPAGVVPPAHAVQAIAPSSDGGLWVATLAGADSENSGARILKLKAGRWEAELAPYPWPQDSARSRVRALHEDKQGRLWSGTAGRGVFFWSPAGEWQPLAAGAPLAQLDTLCLAEDEGGAIWIGTRTAGVYQAWPRRVTTRQVPGEADQSELVTVCAARDGSVWGGTDGAGVFRWQGRQTTRLGVEQGLSSPRVAALLEDRHTNLWAGTYSGLCRLRGERFEPVTESPALRSATFALLEDQRGRLWAGTLGHVVCWEAGQATVYGRSEGLPSARVRALAEDAEGRIWAALQGAGFYRQEGARFKQYQPKAWSRGQPVQGWLGEGVISAMHWDREGALWLATGGFGLYRLMNNLLDQWEWRIDGLPSNHHLALLEDHTGNLWVSSENGIFGLSKRALNDYRRGQSPLLTPWRLTPAEGLSHKVCSGIGQPTAVQSADGRMWFPDGTALATFDPAAIPHGARTRPPVLEEVIVDGVRLAPAGDGTLSMKSGARTFDFHYTSPNILSPERLRFRYRLEGLAPEWIEAGDRRVASFNRLPPGRYQFSVMAAGPEGAWQQSTSRLPLEVIPRIHERRPVQVAAALGLLCAVAGSAWGVERSRSRRRLERLKAQQAMDHERQRIAGDIHDDLGAGLTEIIMLGDSLRGGVWKTPPVEKVAQEISTHARTLTRAMDEVVWAINPRNDTLESFLSYLTKFAQDYLTKAGVRCRWDVPLEPPDMPLSAEARHHLYLAAKEAIHNIVKHAGASNVWIRFALQENGFTLEIEDNGKGFDTTNPPARGNGLINLHRRLNELRGQCQVESFPGKGTRVKFVMVWAEPVTPP